MTLWKLFKAIPRALAALIVGVGEFLRNQWAQYTEMGQLLWILALFSIGVDAGISYEFGSTLSYLHAAGFALVAIAFCILPDVSAIEFRKGNKVAAGWIGVACVPLGAVALLTHVGYSASIRVGDMQQAAAQNANYAGRTDNVKELKDKIAFLEKRETQLDQEMDALVSKKVGDWTVSTRPSSPEELDGLIEAKRLEATNEAKRKGCKRECEKRNNELAHLIALRGKAKEIQANSDQHAAALKGAADARNQLADTAYVSSAATNHNETLFKAINLIKTGEFSEAVSVTQREATNTGIMSISSVAFLLLAPLFYLGAGLNRRREEDIQAERRVESFDKLKSAAKPDKDGGMTLNVNDLADDVRQALRELSNQVKGQAGYAT